MLHTIPAFTVQMLHGRNQLGGKKRFSQKKAIKSLRLATNYLQIMRKTFLKRRLFEILATLIRLPSSKLDIRLRPHMVGERLTPNRWMAISLYFNVTTADAGNFLSVLLHSLASNVYSLCFAFRLQKEITFIVFHDNDTKR